MLKLQRGDTLIEVLFAFSILSLVVVGAMAIMNQGSIASQRALETTLVRQEIDAQATTLRFLHDAYVAKYQAGITYEANTPAGQWDLLTKSIPDPPVAASALRACPFPRPPKSFILDPVNAKFYSVSSNKLVGGDTFAQLRYDSTGTILNTADDLWIEAVRSKASGDTNQSNTRYIDFHIYACWDAPGQGPVMTLGTIVRLYEPRG